MVVHRSNYSVQESLRGQLILVNLPSWQVSVRGQRIRKLSRTVASWMSLRKNREKVHQSSLIAGITFADRSACAAEREEIDSLDTRPNQIALSSTGFFAR